MVLPLAAILLACTTQPPAPTCPAGMVLLAGGQAVLGVDRPSPWQQARHTVELPPYCMDAYEYPNRQGQLPTASVSWDQADALCKEQGKRLCTSAEWELACRGTERRTYAYGHSRDAEACNTPIEGSGPPRQPGGTPSLLAPSGSKPRCTTPEGVFDLNGNVSEWVADGWDGPPEPFRKGMSPDGQTWATVRGGTMWSDTFYGQDCGSRHGHMKRTTYTDDGFRCCVSP